MKFIFCILCFFISSIQANQLLIKHIPKDQLNDHRQSYYFSLLKLALSKALPASAYKLEAIDKEMHQGRAFEELENHRLDIIWSMTSIERENHSLPVRIPLLKGLLGYRIFIIRQGEQQRFTNIKQLHQLKNLVAGQGIHWPDTKILQSNQLPVVGGSNYLGLFSMLQRNRFDYFPRGVQEPWQEIIQHKENNLAVEEQLLLRYPSPIFFFVNKENTKLQSALLKGLKIAIKDGSFANLLYSHKITRQIFELGNINKRTIFELDNPLLSEKTKLLLNQPKLWYQPGEELQ